MKSYDFFNLHFMIGKKNNYLNIEILQKNSFAIDYWISKKDSKWIVLSVIFLNIFQ